MTAAARAEPVSGETVVATTWFKETGGDFEVFAGVGASETTLVVSDDKSLG